MSEDARPSGAAVPEGVTARDREGGTGVRPEGWNSPEYTRSRRETLDPGVLRENRCIGVFSDAPETERFKVLRTHLQQRLAVRGWKSFLVTSARPGEGKTFVAVNLAMVFAKEVNRTVLLVDCDLKKQDIHRQLGMTGHSGLGDYLVRGAPLSDLIVWPGFEKFTVISGGEPVLDSTELISSPRMRSLVPELRDRYEDRYIVFDAPPLLEGADALAFLPLVEGVVMVVQEGRTSRRDLRKCLELIPPGQMLGFVLNRDREPAASSYAASPLRP